MNSPRAWGIMYFLVVAPRSAALPTPLAVGCLTLFSGGVVEASELCPRGGSQAAWDSVLDHLLGTMCSLTGPVLVPGDCWVNPKEMEDSPSPGMGWSLYNSHHQERRGLCKRHLGRAPCHAVSAQPRAPQLRGSHRA